MPELRMMSLFSGSGGFELGAELCGIQPIYASEIERFPIEVTMQRFPNMRHLGDVTKINGAELEPVDIVTWGSPCQDLSVAGARAGLDGERSGLFFEAVRIVEEMRDEYDRKHAADAGFVPGRDTKPRWGIWENVPGAFSSQKGEDFRQVLLRLCAVKEQDADVPRPQKWTNAGEILGDGYSIAWRVLDAQYWGVPQRRRRIYLVCDFGGGDASRVLFEREGLCWDNKASRGPWEGASVRAKGRAGKTSVLNDAGGAVMGMSEERVGTLRANSKGYEPIVYNEPAKAEHKDAGGTAKGLTAQMGAGGDNGSIGMQGAQTYSLYSNFRNADYWVRGNADDIASPSLTAFRDGPPKLLQTFGIDRNALNQGKNALIRPSIIADKQPPLVARGPRAAAFTVRLTHPGKTSRSEVYQTEVSRCLSADGYNDATASQGATVAVRDMVVRRLSTTECQRLQGFPDVAHYDENALTKEESAKLHSLTIGDCVFFPKGRKELWHWGYRGLADTLRDIMPPERVAEVFREGGWCDGAPHRSKSQEYKLWGNGVALPCVLYVMQGIKSVMDEEEDKGC